MSDLFEATIEEQIACIEREIRMREHVYAKRVANGAMTPDQPFPERVRLHTGPIRAHNAAFERLICWYVLQINFDLEQFYCTAAQARARGRRRRCARSAS